MGLWGLDDQRARLGLGRVQMVVCAVVATIYGMLMTLTMIAPGKPHNSMFGRARFAERPPGAASP